MAWKSGGVQFLTNLMSVCICICYFCTCSWELCNWKGDIFVKTFLRVSIRYLIVIHFYFVFVTFVFVFGNFATGRWGPDIFVKTFLRTFICNLGQHRHHDSILRMQKSVSLTEIPFYNHSLEFRYNLVRKIGLVSLGPFSG